MIRQAGGGWDSAGGARVLRVAAVVTIVLSLAGIARELPVGGMVEGFSGWVRDFGVWGPIVYVLVYVAAVVAIFPASALTMAAGAIFGPLLGAIVASLGSTIGAALAFLVARRLARDAVAARVRRHPRFEAIDRAVGAGGWRIVALLRLSPAVPFNLQNYLYGLTRIGFWPCILTSWATMLPGTLMYVYLGHAGRAGLGAASGGASRSPAEWAFLGVGLVATIAVTVYVARLAREAMREQGGLVPESDSTADEAADRAASGPSARPWETSIWIAAAAAAVAVVVYVHVFPGAIESLFRGLAGPP